VVKDGNPSSLKPPEDYDPEADADKGGNAADADNDDGRGGKVPKTKKPWIRRLFPCL
jgi:hypothetical protein